MVDSVYEPIEHGKLLLAKVFVTGMDSSHYHWHHDYELLLVLKGAVTVFCGPEPALLHAGDIILINSRVVHGYRGERDNLCLFIQFSPTPLETLVDKSQLYYFYLNSTSQTMVPKSGYEFFVRQAAQVGVANLGAGITAPLRTMARLELLLADLLDEVQYDIRRYALSHDLPPEGHLVARISAYVNEHCEEHNLVETVCKHFAIGEKSLYRYIKTALGMSPKGMIDQARVERAKALLRSSECPVALVGEQCGFTSEVTFHRVFKRETGRTPKAYRQEENRSLVGKDIQGYLHFDPGEAARLLRQYAGE